MKREVKIRRVKWYEDKNELCTYDYYRTIEFSNFWTEVYTALLWILPVLIVAAASLCYFLLATWHLLLLFAFIPYVIVFICWEDYRESYFIKKTAEQRALIEALIQQENEAEEAKAEEWRSAHPLEEKCRLALTKNPNYVADLIRYIQEQQGR